MLPLFSHGSQTHPTLEELQEAGAAAAWYPTTMAGLQASWDFLNDFKDRGTSSIDDSLAKAAQNKWGFASNGSILGTQRIREMEDKSLTCAATTTAWAGAVRFPKPGPHVLIESTS